jgi:hypothetical protein
MSFRRRPGPVTGAGLAVGAAAATILVIATLAGHLTGRQDAPPQPSASKDSSRRPTLGPVRVAVPPEWRRLPVSAARITGIEKQPTEVFDRTPGLSARAVLTVASPGSPISPSLLPKALQDAAERPPGRPTTVRLDRQRAWMYHAVPVRRSNETMEITVLPTTAGLVAIACIEPPGLAFAAAGGCASELGLTLQRGKALRPTDDLGFRLRLGGVVADLDRERVADRASLRRSRTPRAQASAARQLAAAHARAAGALAPFARSDATAKVVASLRAASGGYKALSRSATAYDRAAFAQARRAIDESDRRLTLTLGAFTGGDA